MTLGTISRVTYVGTGSPGPFAIPFKFFDGADLEVIIRGTDGTESTLAESADFTVTGERDASGTLTLTANLLAGEVLTIRRDPTPAQSSSFRNQSSYFGSSHEDALDRVMMIVQAIKDSADRSVRLPASYDPESHDVRVKPETGKALVWQDSSTLGNSALDSSTDVALPGEDRTTETLTALLLNNIGAVINALDYANDAVSDAAVLNAAAAAAADAGKLLLVPRGSEWDITSTVTVNCSHMAEGAIVRYSGTGTAWRVGDDSSILANIVAWTPTLTNVDKTAIGWGTQNGHNVGATVGLRCLALYQSQIFVGQVEGFGIGLLEDGGVNGSAHVTFHLSHLIDNKINHKVTCNALLGFCNENTHVGGRLSYNGAEGTAVAGTRHILIDDVVSVINGHQFTKVSVEGNVPEFTIECYGGDNAFDRMRWETQGAPPIVRMNGANAVRNEFIGGVDLRRVQWLFVNGAASVLNRVVHADGERWAPASTAGTHIWGNQAGSDKPIIRLLKSGVDPFNRAGGTTPRDGSETDHTYTMTALGQSGKADTDGTDRWSIDNATGNVSTVGAFIGPYYKTKGTVNTPGSATFVDVFTPSAAGSWDFTILIANSGNPAFTSSGKIVHDGSSVYIDGTPTTGANITIQIAAGKLQLKRNDGIATTFNYTVKYAPL